MSEVALSVVGRAQTEPVLRTEDLRLHYVSQVNGVRRVVQAVDGVSIAIAPNEILGIAGESGCGKSTLLRALLGSITPPLTVQGGSLTYRVDGRELDVLSLWPAQLRDLRWKFVSYIPQGSMHVLNPVRRVRHTFRDFVRAHRPVSAKEADGLAHDYVSALGLRPSVLDAFPHQLSGGMRQRVTIALATILSPRLVLADEPTTALDVVTQRVVLDLLGQTQRRTQSALAVVTHDMGVHANLADRVAVLYAGKLVEEADTATLFREPRHPYTRFLIQSLPKMGDRSDRVSIPGSPPRLDDPPRGCRFHPRCPHAMAICRERVPSLDTVAPGHRVACFLESGADGNG